MGGNIYSLELQRYFSLETLECGFWLGSSYRQIALCGGPVTGTVYSPVPLTLPYFDFMSFWLESRLIQIITKTLC